MDEQIRSSKETIGEKGFNLTGQSLYEDTHNFISRITKGRRCGKDGI